MTAAALALVALVAAVPATPQAAIDAALADSAAGWNTGDLDRFVAVYAADAIYVAGGKVVRGKPAIAARYARSFTAGGNKRGRLGFRPLALRAVDAGHMLYIARWTLTPKTGATQTGLTSLLFERTAAGWRIIADHSS